MQKMKNVLNTAICAFLLIVLFGTGCTPSGSPESAQENETAAEAKDSAEAESSNASDSKEQQVDVGDMGKKIRAEKKFQYPETLADVEKMAEECGGWMPHPVRSSYEVVYEHFNPEEPHKSFAEAEQMKNNSPEENAEIAAAYQRMPNRKNLTPDQDSPEVNYDGELHRHIGADTTSFNPLFFNSSTDKTLMEYTQVSLFATILKTLEYVGCADTIVSWETSKDHMFDKFVLRDDLLWSDGTPVTAYDWEFSYNVIMTSAVPIFAIRSGTDLLMGVKAYDERTLVFFHQEAIPISRFSINYPIIPKHIYEKSILEDPTLVRSEYHQKQEKEPVVAGPYFVEKHLFNSSITLKARENYYTYNGKRVREKPFFNRVHFHISPDTATAFMQMKNGDIEQMSLQPEQWVTQASIDSFYDMNTKAAATSWTYFALWFNLGEDCPYFQDIRVRKALSLVFDYEELLKVHRKSLDTQCRGLYAESAPFFPKDANLPYLKQDYTEARKLLEEAGWTDTDNDGLLDKEWKGERIPFQFTILSTNAPDRVEICNLFARCVKHIGIECFVQPMEFNAVCRRNAEHKFHMTLGGWGAGIDPYSSQNIWGTGEGRNYSSYSNSEVDRLFAEGLKEFDHAKRMKIYQEIHKHIYADYPCIWLYNRNTSIGFNKKLRGVGFDYSSENLGAAWKEASEN